MSIKAHGLDAYRVRNPRTEEGVFTRVLKLPLRAAWEIAKDSPWVEFSKYVSTDEYPGDQSFRNNAGLVNKGWVLLGLDSGGISALYNHDGSYYLLTGSVENVLAMLVWQVQISGASRPSKSKALAEEIALITNLNVPWETSFDRYTHSL